MNTVLKKTCRCDLFPPLMGGGIKKQDANKCCLGPAEMEAMRESVCVSGGEWVCIDMCLPVCWRAGFHFIVEHGK